MKRRPAITHGFKAVAFSQRQFTKLMGREDGGAYWDGQDKNQNRSERQLKVEMVGTCAEDRQWLWCTENVAEVASGVEGNHRSIGAG